MNATERVATTARQAGLNSDVRALDVSRDLIIALRMCEKVLHRARNEVDESSLALVARMSQHLYCMSELAKQVQQQQVDKCTPEGVAFREHG
ncbi:MAG TPA: hypothetical protein VF943_09935 [Burkholderiales bacterium]